MDPAYLIANSANPSMQQSQLHPAYRHIIAWACCLFVCALAGCLLTGCIESDPNKNINIVIVGIESAAEQKEVIEILEAMYDKERRDKRFKSQFRDNQLTVEMEPVTNVETFARRIDFGTVTEVTGRTIKVTYAKSHAKMII
jgi:hypothetical protein